jgi:hypothetical protein
MGELKEAISNIKASLTIQKEKGNINAEFLLRRMRVIKESEPCDHAGCLSHLSHPCEGCGRISGKGTAVKHVKSNWKRQRRR